jgi:putative peptidoglycan lipid II flippase
VTALHRDELESIEPHAGSLRSVDENDDSLVGDSLSGSVWTAVSRVTGFVRAAGIAAVLGATYFGNTFQALNSLPNLVYYQLLAGSLFASVLVPTLVRHVNAGDERRAREVLNGFLGAMLFVAAAAGLLLFAGGWLVLQVMAAGVANPHIAAAQRHVGLLLLIVFVPQVALYVIAGVGAAAMNAKRRFAIAAGAPALENVGIILFLVLTVIIFGAGTDITKVSDAEVIVLGVGATLAVLWHASLQMWGAHRVGMSMIPTRGWHDADVRVVVRRMVPALAFTVMAFLQVIAFLVAANRVAGGVVALQLALNFFYLPLAIVAWPIARALLPQLARRISQGSPRLFADDLRRAVALASFVAIPICVGYLTLSFPLARVIAFGKLGPHGVHLLGWSVAAIGPGILAETWFILGTYASYAREDMRTPLRPMAVNVGVSIALLLIVLPVKGDMFVPLLGAALSIGSLAGAVHLSLRVRRSLQENGATASPATAENPSLGSSILRSFGASLVMAGPGWLAALLVERLWDGKISQILALTAAGSVCVVVFVGMHLLMKSPELGWIKTSMFKKGSRRVEVAAS